MIINREFLLVIVHADDEQKREGGDDGTECQEQRGNLPN